ncbi:MAG: GNAT family protein [Dehalococcoidia bacterium]
MTAASVRLDVFESADLRGELTRLRPMRPDEAPRFYQWTRDPDVAPWWAGVASARTLEEFLADWEPYYFDGSRPGLGRSFAIEADGKLIGMIATNRVEVHDRQTEIDIVIGEPGYRDRGYGTDALRATLRFLFDTVGLHRVWLATYEHNARARRAYEKAGFREEGLLRESDRVDGRWVNSVVYGILDHEFRRLCAAHPEPVEG